MHIKPAEGGTSGSARANEAARKLRLGVATRVPVNGQTKTTDSPLRVLVSAIGQSLGSRTPMRNQSASGVSSAAKSLNLSSAAKPASTTAPVKTRSTVASSSSGGRMNANHSSAANLTGTPATASTMPATAGTPSRRSSLSSSSSSTSTISSSNSSKKQSILSTPPTSRKPSVAQSRASTKPDLTTPVTKNPISARTPKAQNNSTTPTSKVSCISLPTPRRRSMSSTPRPNRNSLTPGQTRSKSIFPTTPVSKPMSANPTTPVDCETAYSTPQGSNPFYTPKSSFPPTTPLQPRNHNVLESSRRLHFGINLAAMVEQQENVGSYTPRPFTPAATDATFSFDKDRLAQIKASRRTVSQLLKSPAQRVRVPSTPNQSSIVPGRALQQLAEDRSARFDGSESLPSLNESPARRRVANSLF